MVNNDKFYEFRSHVRKKLGRLVLIPENNEKYAIETMHILMEYKEMTGFYLEHTTENEIKALGELLKYIKPTEENLHTLNMIKNTVEGSK